jgi:Tol biopolymer transport system component
MNANCPAEKDFCLTEPQLLFEMPSRIFNITWSPDGSEVIFIGEGVNNKSDIFLADWDGSNLHNLTSSPDGESNPVWSPDGKRIAYIYASATEDVAIRSLNLNEGETERFLEEVFNPSAFVWLPQNRLAYIAQISAIDWRQQITVTDLAGQGLNHVPTNATDFTGILGLAPSPDGQRFAFTGHIIPSTPGLNTSNNIYITDNTHGDYMSLTDDFSTNLSPAWSPSGDRIAFSSDIDGNYDIYLITTDSSGRMKVTESLMDETDPAWRLIPPP